MKENRIYNLFKRNEKQLAILLDPDKIEDENKLSVLLKNAEKAKISFIFVGGSLVSASINELSIKIRKYSKLPLILFPGNANHVTNRVDAILLLSLVSGRNPEFLIGNHVVAAPFLKKSTAEIISTGYMLIESGQITSAEYMSNTKPIPYHKADIAVATAIASEMIGHKLIFADAGSGASKSISSEMISKIKENISIPLIVGGGVRSMEDVSRIFDAGADIIVIGTAIEQNPDFLSRIIDFQL